MDQSRFLPHQSFDCWSTLEWISRFWILPPHSAYHLSSLFMDDTYIDIEQRCRYQNQKTDNRLTCFIGMWPIKKIIMKIFRYWEKPTLRQLIKMLTIKSVQKSTQETKICNILSLMISNCNLFSTLIFLSLEENKINLLCVVFSLNLNWRHLFWTLDQSLFNRLL